MLKNKLKLPLEKGKIFSKIAYLTVIPVMLHITHICCYAKMLKIKLILPITSLYYTIISNTQKKENKNTSDCGKGS